MRCTACSWSGMYLNDWIAFGAWLAHWVYRHGEWP